MPRVDGALARRLAYYASGDLGVLGPRGWHCFGLYGSNGSILIVTPERHGGDLFASGSGLKGPAIQLTAALGDTSGRFEVARVAARLFPSRRAFVDQVIQEGLEPQSSFPRGPFPRDVLKRYGDNVVAFETPAGYDGMGTKSRLLKNADPISGLATIDPDNNLLVLDVRLPSGLRDLGPTIIDRVQRRGGG